MKFEWVTPPPADSVLCALEALVNAGMLGKEDARLTEVGAKVAEVPVDIGVARMVSDFIRVRCFDCGAHFG